MSKLGNFCRVIRKYSPELTFTMLELGGLPLHQESFYSLIPHFPGSRIISFELEAELCESLNKTAATGVTFYPRALARSSGYRVLYVTRESMCCSLYEPNADLNDRYMYLSPVDLVSTTSIRTVGLDEFLQSEGIDSIDFIKADIQGAELEVFQGGVNALSNTVMIISEVELIPNYKDQPLFGDVCAFLSANELMFHKFFGFGSRNLKRFPRGQSMATGSQMIWGDACFIRDPAVWEMLTNEQLLKLSVLAFCYESFDIAYVASEEVDRRCGSSIAAECLRIFDL